MLAGCSSSTATTATASAAVTAAAATATPDTAKVTTSQTAPVTLSADGVISDAAMSTITLRTNSGDQNYLKADDFACDGVLMVGAPATVSYTVDTDGSNVALSLTIDTSKQMISGTIADEAMSTITVTVAVQDSNQDISFLKSDCFYETEGLEQGAAVKVCYDGDLDNGPTALSVIADDSTIVVAGVIVDQGMSAFQIKSSMDGSERGFTKSDNMTIDGTMARGSQVVVQCHYENADCIADSVTVNMAPRSITGTVKEEAMSTITITADGTDYQFMKGDDRVVDDYSTGDTVTVNYTGELDGEPIAYAILK